MEKWLLILVMVPFAYATDHYVAQDGSGDYTSIQDGVDGLQAGDTLYVRAGTYNERVRMYESGTADAPIIISGYPGEIPVIDGEDDLPGGGIYNALVQIDADYVVFKDFEIKRSSGRGFCENGGSHILISGLNIHHCWMAGIIFENGDNNIADNCEVWQTDLSIDAGEWPSSGGWPAAVEWADEEYSVLRNSKVYKNYGEGVIMLRSSHTIVEDNVIYDNLKLQLYLDNAPYALAQRNLLYQTDDQEYWRSDSGTPTLVISDEEWSGDAPLPGHHRTIINNVIIGGSSLLSYWKQSDNPLTGLNDDVIAYNTMIEGRSYAMRFNDDADHNNVRIENNIILQSSGSLYEGSTDSGLDFSDNLWSRSVSGIASGNGDVVGDPLLVKSSGWHDLVAGEVDEEWFKLTAGSPAIDAAMEITEVDEDYFSNTRDVPDIGAVEFGGTNFCGDGNCDPDENCTTCEVDCGECPDTCVPMTTIELSFHIDEWKQGNINIEQLMDYISEWKRGC